jgi:hypothetical protein
VVRDVTDERRLRESEKRMRLVVSATHDGMWEVDVRSRRLWWSDGMFALLGDAMPEDLDTAVALVHPDDLAVVRAGFERARGGPVRGTVRLRHSTGGWRRLDSWAVAETDPVTGLVTRVAGIVNDRSDGRLDGPRARAETLSDTVLGPVESAAAQLRLAAVALPISSERAGDLIDTSAAHLTRARDAVEELILSELRVARADGT